VLPIMAAARGVVAASLVTYALLFVSSLFLGRAFCGWLCPGGATQELLALAVRKPAKGGWRYAVKYVVSALWLTGLVVAAVRAGGLHRFDPAFGAGSGSAARSVMLRFGAYLLIVPLGLLFGRWASCHYLCWIAPFLVLGARLRDWLRLPSLRLSANAAACKACTVCNRGCPMSLDVRSLVRVGAVKHDECVLCGNCVDHCPSGAVRFRFGTPAPTAGR
jgi:polyferredoxin